MSRNLSVALAALLTASVATAQGRHVFDIDPQMSSFQFSGNVSYSGLSGPLVGQPSTFSMSGAASADLTIAGGTLTAASLVAGNTTVDVPALSAIVPNIFPFLPPLATVNVSATKVVFDSVDPNTLAPATFVPGPGGAFTTDVTATILSGSAMITALGSTQTIPLAGAQSDPQQVSGVLVARTDGFRLSVTLQTTFSFADPMTGASGTLTLNGQAVGFDRALASATDTISLATGGVQTLTLSAGTAQSGRTYLLLGSTSGTQPGLTVGSVTIPLQPDSYFITTAVQPNTPPLGNSLGVLGALGDGTATFSLPPLPIPALVGLHIDHAYLLLSGANAVAASNPVGVTLAP